MARTKMLWQLFKNTEENSVITALCADQNAPAAERHLISLEHMHNELYASSIMDLAEMRYDACNAMLFRQLK